ncbi:hypothetical protein GCM10020220_085290 [Nonomuraea rubra]|uniref:molybdopterin-dependent oxidoreductase n=1 Tax=Nonomuraea rubra TaxID=46180 RepID=UPI0033752A3B
MASPQVFGDQTDVPESADWWDAAYLMLWGSNVPVTRTPDAHYMAEARYHGQKVVVLAPDYNDDAAKFADEWLAPHPGTDGALAMAMGHVILKEFFTDRPTPAFADYVKRFTDLPFLIRLRERNGSYVPDKFLTAADLGQEGQEAAFATVLVDARTGEPVVPNGSLGFRYSDQGQGRWNLDLDGVDPLLTCLGPESVPVALPRFDGHGDGVLQRGVPVRRVGAHLVTTVYDLMLAQYGVAREGLPGRWPSAYDDAAEPYTPAWQEAITGVPAAAGGPHRAGIRPQRRGVRRPFHDHHGCGDESLVPPRHDLPLVPGADDADRLSGRQRGAAGRTTSVRRSAGRSPGGRSWPSGWTGRARPGR